MTPHKKIFCNSPWFELQIYWDGKLGFCCQESHLMYDESQTQYNIKNMTIAEWFDSDPMRRARTMMFNSTPNSLCTTCYRDESLSTSSRRIRHNQKSVIFTKTNFQDSFDQSPHKTKFVSTYMSNGSYQDLPVDLHIDLGNYCNLACKMCSAEASSLIAVQEIKWGNREAKKFIANDWTKNPDVWNRTMAEIAQIQKLRNIHFMGGETLLTGKLKEFLEYLIQANRTNINISLVTNGTVFDEDLMRKFNQFQRIGIEVSIETLTPHNAYVRQGTNTSQVIKNLFCFLEWQNNFPNTFDITVRPAISALTLGNYHTLLEFCLEHKILVKSLLVNNPDFLSVKVLPLSVKQDYRILYQNLWDRYSFDIKDITVDFNESDRHQYKKVIANQVYQCLKLCDEKQVDIDLQNKLVNHCLKWDRVYQLDAKNLYPELIELFNRWAPDV